MLCLRMERSDLPFFHTALTVKADIKAYNTFIFLHLTSFVTRLVLSHFNALR